MIMNCQKGDGITCTDLDECRASTPVCDQLCTNSVGSYQCSCRTGFRYQSSVLGSQCDNINECGSSVLHLCFDSVNCLDTVGKL